MLRPWKTIFQVPFDANSPTPLYLQVEKYVISEIRAGRFPENMILPSYRKIAAENRVSETTVRTAFRRLKERKWIRSEPRKGNFICYREEFREEREKTRLRQAKRINQTRSAERRVGQECHRKCGDRGGLYQEKKNGHRDRQDNIKTNRVE